MHKNKKILVAGGTGTIGAALVPQLLAAGADVTVVSMDSPAVAKRIVGDVRFIKKDLTLLENCMEVTRGQEYVFNLVGIKGSTGIGEKKVASYFVPMLWFQTNLMEAAFRNQVSRYLFTSSICGYPQSSEPKKEDTMWDGMPKQNDRIPGIAKRVGEVQGEAYMLEYGWDAVRIVRPSNVYGPFDDFDPKTAQVIPALIARIVGGENPLKVWGDGSAIRDFVYADDVAYWMLQALEQAPPCVPINIGSGEGISVKRIVETIADCIPHPPRVEWDTTKPTGDAIRILSVARAEKLLNYRIRTDLKAGIQKTVNWYLKNQELLKFIQEQRYARYRTQISPAFGRTCRPLDRGPDQGGAYSP